MEKPSAKRLILYFLLTAIFSPMLVSCSVLHFIFDGEEQQTTIRDEEYSIDSNTILANISQGDIQVFNLLMATPPVYPPLSDSVKWGQDDFCKVAQAFYSAILKEKIADWQLTEIAFNLKCDEIDKGPQYVRFGFFRYLVVKKENVRLKRDLFITPNQNLVVFSETEYQPVYEKWSVIDPSKIKIKIEDALEIAENNQGKEFRQQVDNQCSISANLDANGKYSDGWFVAYTELSDQQTKRLWLIIDIQQV